MQEYNVTNAFYADKVAVRSGLPLMRHIDDGLHILTHQLNQPKLVLRAWCLHPLVQNDEDVDVTWSPAYNLACEYRDRANSYLCRRENDWISTAEQLNEVVGPMSHECAMLLMADKRQNYGDFIQHHYLYHHRSEQLDKYFRLWIQTLTKYYVQPYRNPQNS